MSLKINKREFKKWIAALDSGEYRQSYCMLQDERGFCCLGVGCSVTIPAKLLQLNASGSIYGHMPTAQLAAPNWLKEIDLNFDAKTGRTLASLNDDEGYAFPEIATLLELVYIHKILD